MEWNIGLTSSPNISSRSSTESEWPLEWSWIVRVSALVEWTGCLYRWLDLKYSTPRCRRMSPGQFAAKYLTPFSHSPTHNTLCPFPLPRSTSLSVERRLSPAGHALCDHSLRPLPRPLYAYWSLEILFHAACTISCSSQLYQALDSEKLRAWTEVNLWRYHWHISWF